MWLFLALRQRPYGRETVVEIGDFVAHQEERFKGITTQTARDFFTFIRFQTLSITGRNAIDLGNAPKNFPEVLAAGFRRLDSAIIKQDTGLKRNVANKLLVSLNTRFVPLPSGNLKMQHAQQKEVDLLKCIVNHIAVTPAFTEDRVFTETRDVLLKNGLLLPTETKEFSKVQPAITLFVVSVMHQCMVI